MKRRKVALIIYLVLISILLSGCTLGEDIVRAVLDEAVKDSGQVMLDSIVRPTMNSFEQKVDNWYLFHNDRVYAYYYTYKDGDLFFSTDLHGRDKKLISDSEDMRYAELQLVYDGYVYYYTTYNQGIKKVNIMTGEIENVINGEYLHFIPDTLKDGKVVVSRLNNVLGEEHVYFAKLDLNTGILSDEKTLSYIPNVHYYSIGHNKVYVVNYDQNYNYTLYEDDRAIYTYKGKMNDKSIAFRTNDYIYILTDQEIMKIDKDTYELVEQKDLIENDFKMYNSARDKSFSFKNGELNPYFQSTKEPIFSSDNKAYKFNEDKMDFKEIGDAPKYGHIQEYKDYLIIQSHLKTTLINKKTSESVSYNSSHSFVCEGYLYIMTFVGDFYYQNSTVCNFKVVKIKL